MPRYSKEDFDRYFDYGVFAPKRLIYIGSPEYTGDNDGESGTDHLMAEKAIKGITYLDTISDKPIVIIMDNPGGHFTHGMAIYDTIKSSRCHATIIAIGNCSSMGSIIFQAADLRVISQNCEFYIHDGTVSFEGNAKDFAEWSKKSELDRKKTYEIYKEKMIQKIPTITIKQIERLCSLDRFYNAQETVDSGLADEILNNINSYIKE